MKGIRYSVFSIRYSVVKTEYWTLNTRFPVSFCVLLGAAVKDSSHNHPLNMIQFLDYSTEIEYHQTMRMNATDKFNNRFGVMIILGDFILPNQKTFWLDEFLTKLSWLGVLERTGRSTLVRMAKDGWFSVEKVGRRNRYTLTAWGESVLRQGDLRIFEQAMQDWDGQWHLVTYSLPDEKRVLRHHLVQQLRWLGFGRISRGTWLSPHDRRAALRQALKAPETNDYLHFFSGSYLGNTEIDQLIKTKVSLLTTSLCESSFRRSSKKRELFPSVCSN